MLPAFYSPPLSLPAILKSAVHFPILCIVTFALPNHHQSQVWSLPSSLLVMRRNEAPHPVHSPQMQDMVKCEQCTDVTVQGNPRRLLRAQIVFCTHLLFLKQPVLLFDSLVITTTGSLLVACYDCGFMCATRLPPVSKFPLA
jgi:hypothetical protein